MTGIWVARARRSVSRLSWRGSRCCTSTKAIPVLRRQMGEELGEGLEAPGGSADPDDGKGAFRPWLVCGRGLGLIRRGVVPRFPGGVR